MTLRLDWIGYDAVAYACRHWHYSRSVPAGRLTAIGAWEGGAYKGAVVFSRGATPRIGSPYGLAQTEVCELTRVALREHDAPVTRILAIALRMLRRHAPGLRLVVSYAAAEQGHHGSIYQGGGWIYEGPMESHGFRLKGEFVHSKSIHSRYGTGSQRLEWLRQHVDPTAEKIDGLVRHKYLMPLDAEMQQRVRPLAIPYPKRCQLTTETE